MCPAHVLSTGEACGRVICYLAHLLHRRYRITNLYVPRKTKPITTKTTPLRINKNNKFRRLTSCCIGVVVLGSGGLFDANELNGFSNAFNRTFVSNYKLIIDGNKIKARSKRNNNKSWAKNDILFIEAIKRYIMIGSQFHLVVIMWECVS